MDFLPRVDFCQKGIFQKRMLLIVFFVKTGVFVRSGFIAKNGFLVEIRSKIGRNWPFNIFMHFMRFILMHFFLMKL